LAFVGPSGQLLTKMISAMGLERADVHIINIIKCRPPNNRTPLPDEVAACFPYLKAQIAAMRPHLIVALGAVATKALLGQKAGVMKLRGTWHSFAGIPLMPTYHPAYLLRYPEAKRSSWNDLQEVLKHLGRTPPPRKKDGQTSP
jgi:uracil-DNA glycosylase family 4